MTTATGVITGSEQLGEFFAAFSGSELSREHHNEKPVEVKVLAENSFQVTMFIKEHADFLIRSSLEDGMLRKWKDRFTVKK